MAYEIKEKVEYEVNENVEYEVKEKGNTENMEHVDKEKDEYVVIKNMVYEIKEKVELGCRTRIWTYQQKHVFLKLLLAYYLSLISVFVYWSYKAHGKMRGWMGRRKRKEREKKEGGEED